VEIHREDRKVRLGQGAGVVGGTMARPTIRFRRHQPLLRMVTAMVDRAEAGTVGGLDRVEIRAPLGQVKQVRPRREQILDAMERHLVGREERGREEGRGHLTGRVLRQVTVRLRFNLADLGQAAGCGLLIAVVRRAAGFVRTILLRASRQKRTVAPR